MWFCGESFLAGTAQSGSAEGKYKCDECQVIFKIKLCFQDVGWFTGLQINMAGALIVLL
jgi:hypothetical protein